MAKSNEVSKLKEESRKTARKALREAEAPLEPPRKAISTAKKLSKGQPYQVAPYAGVGLRTLYSWTRVQWEDLGRHQRLALPVIIFVALRTWEKERRLQENRWFELEKADAKRFAANIYGAYGAPKKRKLLGIIPLP
jgi:hypothetical protein